MALHYQGKVNRIDRAEARPGLKYAIANWITRVDAEKREYEQECAEARAKLLVSLPACNSRHDLEFDKRAVARCGLGGDAEIAGLLKASEERLDAAEELERREREQTRERIKAEVLDSLSRAGSIYTANGWEQYVSSPFGYELRNDPDIAEAVDAAIARIRAEDERVETALNLATEAAFYPFRWYEVVYSIIGRDDGEMAVETRSFPSLSPDPDADGWWTPTNEEPCKVAYLVRIVRHECKATEELPTWCPRRKVTDGTIRVPPEGAERL